MKLLCLLLFIGTFSTMAQTNPSSAKSYAFRLGPHQDVKKSIMDFARQNKIKAGCIVSAVGSVEQFNIRFANQENGTKKKGFFEIVSLTGTFSETSSHIHISVSDDKGVTTGGHLLEDNLIYTTLELVVCDLTDVEFTRETDATYGYSELTVKPRSKK